MKKHRKIIAIVLCITLSFSVNVGLKQEKKVYGAEKSKTLKILAIGNSFSQDAQRWLYQIAEAAGYEDITIANLYWGGCSLWQHAKNAKEDYGANDYEYQLNTNGEIQYKKGYTIRTAVQAEDWDFITLQQVSGDSGRAETYNEDLNYLIDYVKKYAKNPNVKLGWHMTWAYQGDSTHGDFAKYNNNQMTMYQGIVNASKTKIETNNNFSFVIPAGTAIQNLRTSFLGDHLTRDGYHMSYELGRYVVGLAWIYKISELMGNPYPTNITYTPSGTKVPACYLPAIREAVMQAVKNPYSVTNSSYPNDPGNIYTNEFQLLDWQPHCYGFWNSTDGNDYGRIVEDSGISKNYIASSRFSKRQLPYGSVIEVANGYQYRPEGWTDLNKKNENTRPGIVGTQRVTVTEDWWGNYNYRGFNLLKADGSSMENISAEQAKNILKIYVPKSSAITENNIDLNKYVKIDWEPRLYTYWHSAGDISQTLGKSENFISSKLFTRQELPVGTLIQLDQSWKYRPEGWVSQTSTTANRPGEVEAPQVKITDAWWGDFNYRAFNVSSAYGENLTNLANEAKSAFRIYLPKALSDGEYTIISKSSGKALAIENDSVDNMAGICQKNLTNEDSQIWKLQYAGNGYYYIINKKSGKALDVPGGSTEEGTQPIQYSHNNGNNQQWNIVDLGEGYYRISPKNAPKQGLDVSGNSKEDGSKIVQWTYRGADNEIWEIHAPGKVIRPTEEPTEPETESKEEQENLTQSETENYPKKMLWSSSFENANYYQTNIIGTKGTKSVSGETNQRIEGNISGSIGEYSGSNSYNDYENMGNLFDGKGATKYLTSEKNPVINVKLRGNAQVIHSYYITSANDAEERDPKSWILQGRNNDNEGWTQIDSRNNETFSSRYQRRYFNVSGNNKSFSQYRLQITENKGNVELTQMAELGFATGEVQNTVGMKTEITNGPKSAWNQKENVGWSGTHSLVCTGKHEGKGNAYSYNVIFDDLGIKVEENTNLRYVIFPDLSTGEQYDYEFTSMHMAIDLKFTDGTYLSDLASTDQYGNALTAQGQADGRALLTKQWNEIYSQIGRVAKGKTIDQILAVYNMKEHQDEKFAESRTYFDDVEIYNQDIPKYSHLSDYVNILRGSNGTGNFSTGLTAPAVTVPNGFNFWTPSNQNGSNTIYQYQQTDNFRYMQVSHEPSIWIGDRGTWQFMVNTSQNSNTNADYGLGTLKANFSHENEIAKAHYYKISFDGNGGDAANSTMELTPTSHGAVVRFTYADNAANRSVIFDCNRGGNIESYDGKTFRAYSDHKSNGSKRMYVYGEFSETPVGTRRDGTKSIASFNKNQVVMKVATSYISYEQAKKNLELEIGNDSFDTVYSKAQKTWDEQLGIITDVKGASYEQLVTLYSCIYRMYCYPNLMSENTGSNENPVWKYKSPYRDDNASPVDGKIYINNGFWDTYRTAWSAYQLFTPSKATEYLNGLVQHYKDQGWVPRWIAPGGTNSMVGTSSDIIFGDAMAKGINFDYENAYNSAIKNASVVSDNLTNGGRNKLNQSNFIGYAEGGGENFSWSIEGYINDFGIAQMAKKLAEQTDNAVQKQNYLSEYQYFLNRSKNYSILFYNGGNDITKKWLRGKNADGGFTTGNMWNGQFDPFFFGSDYTETNAFNMAVSVPQDGIGLANLYGGRDQLANKLDTIFTTNGGFRGYNAIDGVGGIHEQKEAREIKLGQYGHSNQPSHHIPYMYLYSSRPWETTKYVRDILNRCYMGATFGQGYIGDEDNGEMSAWYVQSAIGFYPLSLGTDEYAIGAPLFDEVTIHLENNKKLVIKANNNSKENVYVDSMYVNGQRYNQSFIKYSTLENGGTIEFNMSATPNKTRGSSTEQLARSTTGDNNPQVYKDFTGDANKDGTDGVENLNNLYDNNSDSYTRVNNTTTLMFNFNEAKAVRMLTLTSAQNGRTPDRAQVYADNNDNNWQLLGDFHDSDNLYFRSWGKYTRPFALDKTKIGNYKRYRVVLTGTDAYLAEVELLGYTSDNVFLGDLNQAIEKANIAKNKEKNAENTAKLDYAISYARTIYNKEDSSDDEIKDAYQRIHMIVDLSKEEIAYKDAKKIEAEQFDAKSSAIVNDGNNIGGVKQNSWVRYDNVDFSTYTNQVEVYYSAQNKDAGGTIEFYLDSKDGEPIGTVNVHTTGDGWGYYTTDSGMLNQEISGVHNLYLVFRNDGSHEYVANVDWISFKQREVESSTEEPTTKEQTTEYQGLKPQLEGFQISTTFEGTRVVGKVQNAYDGKEAKSYGFIFGLSEYSNVYTGITDKDLKLGSNNTYVRSYEIQSLEDFTNTAVEGNEKTIICTMKFGAKNSIAYNANYKVCVYVELSDGSVIYSDVYNYSVFKIADYVYKNKLMSRQASHEYLYNNILKVVNPNYEKVDYPLSNTLVK